jgi:hypothetical protein
MTGASSPWDSVGTFSTLELCKRCTSKLRPSRPWASRSPKARPLFLAAGADQDIRGQCLTDTDDPRGPKGK